MHENAGTALFEAPTQAQEYTLWQHPFRDLRIYLHSTALSAISNRALQSLKAKEPSEIGGILRGRRLVGPNAVTVIIVEAEFVRAEGLLYNRAQVDSEALLRALKQQTNQGGSSIVGYFRSHIREDLCLSTEDEDLITRNIRDPNSIFLLVRPFDIGMCMAAFFFWENGKLQTDGSDLEVPFVALEEPIGRNQIFNGHRSGSASPESGSHIGTDGQNKSPNEPLPEEAPTTIAARTASHIWIPSELDETRPIIQIPPGAQMMTVLASAGEDTMQSRHGGERSLKQSSSSQAPGQRDRPLFAMAAALAFLAVVIGGVYLTLPALRSYLLVAPTYSHSTPIGLSVIRATDGHLDISWNRDAPELARAQSARIAITDGSLYKEVKMDNAQLHVGKLAYFPNSPDVQFRLEVYLDSRRSLAESVRVISPASKTTGAEPVFQLGSRGIETPLPVHLHRPSASIPPNGISVKLVSHVDLKSRSPFDSKGIVPQIHNEIPLPEVPLLAADELNPSHSAPLTGLTSAPPFLTSLPVAKPPAGISQTGNTGTFVPPRPIKKVIPNWIYLGQPPVVYETTQIEVQVDIDATGRVMGARRVQNGKKADMRLVDSAVSAAKQWTFEPAMIHGKPIAANHVLMFVFHPSSK